MNVMTVTSFQYTYTVHPHLEMRVTRQKIWQSIKQSILYWKRDRPLLKQCIEGKMSRYNIRYIKLLSSRKVAFLGS